MRVATVVVLLAALIQFPMDSVAQWQDDALLTVLRLAAEHIRSEVDPEGIVRFDPRIAEVGETGSFDWQLERAESHNRTLQQALRGEPARFRSVAQCDESGYLCKLDTATVFVILSNPCISDDTASVRAVVFEDYSYMGERPAAKATLEIRAVTAETEWTFLDVRPLGKLYSGS